MFISREKETYMNIMNSEKNGIGKGYKSHRFINVLTTYVRKIYRIKMKWKWV